MEQVDTEFSAVYSSFREFEREFDVFDICLDGVPVWERVRWPLFKRTLEQNDTFRSSQTRTDPTSRLKPYLNRFSLWAQNLIRRNPFLSGSHDIVYFGHQRRKQRDDGVWEDIYFDPIHRNTDRDYVHLELDYGGKHLTPAATENLQYLDLIRYTGYLLRKSGYSDIDLSRSDEQTLRDLDRAVSERFGDLELSSLIRTTLQTRSSTLWLYERLLKRLDPSLVVLVTSIGRHTFMEACKNESVPVVEFQYGALLNNKYQLGYNMPEKCSLQTYPDYMFVWGDLWNDGRFLPIPKENIFTVGYPYLEEQAREFEQVESTDQIVFISQGTVGDRLASLAAEVADRGVPYDIVFKIHPGDYGRWHTEYPELDHDNITVLEDDVPLYRLFAESRIQIGVSSTALFEGLYFGLQTYLVELPSVEHMYPLLEQDLATMVSSPDDLHQKLCYQPASTEKRLIFATDTFEKIDAGIETILAREHG